MKRLALRRDDVCSVCAEPQSAGTRAWWDPAAKAVTCERCHGAGVVAEFEPAEVQVQAPAQLDAEEPVAGASARREYERRRGRHQAKIEEKWGSGTVGTIAKALSTEPQSTTAWAKGADGERRLSNHLNRELPESSVVLDDRQIPGTKANIDHLVIADGGIWIVDAKNYKGKVELRTSGWRNPQTTLWVAGRNRTKLVGGMDKQRDAAASALSAIGEPDVPVHLAICFTNADWPLVGGGGVIDGVWIGWARKLVKLISTAPPAIEPLSLAAELSQRLPAAR